MGNGFPGLVVVSAIAVVVALVALLLALMPWPATTLRPQLGLAPGIGVGLGASSPAAPGQAFALAPAHAATGNGGGGQALAAAETVAENSPGLVGDLSTAWAVSAVEANPQAKAAPGSKGATPEAPTAASPEPPAAPAPEPVSAPMQPSASAPVAAAPVQVPYAPGFEPGPISAGTVPPPSMSAEPLEVGAGDEGSVSYSFVVGPTSYTAPGEDSSILRFADPSGEAPTFALQLWDDGAGQQGLWSSGAAMGGERFLAPLAEGAHELTVEYVASSEEEGLYRVSLDGQTVDWRAWVSLLPPGGVALLETGPE